MNGLVCYKYIIQNNQETCFVDYQLTPLYYTSQEACENDWGKEKTEYCFRVVEPLLMSKQIGELAWILTKHEREKSIQILRGDRNMGMYLSAYLIQRLFITEHEKK